MIEHSRFENYGLKLPFGEETRALNGKPVDLIQSISGLISVITYLDSRRALV